VVLDRGEAKRFLVTRNLLQQNSNDWGLLIKQAYEAQQPAVPNAEFEAVLREAEKQNVLATFDQLLAHRC
jgi:hypothetical protein